MKQFQRLRLAVGAPLILLSVSIGSYVAISRSSVIADEPPADAPQTIGIPTPTGKMITPEAAKGAIFQELDPGLRSAPDRRAGYAVALAASPDGKRLAILTSGFPAYSAMGVSCLKRRWNMYFCSTSQKTSRNKSKFCRCPIRSMGLPGLLRQTGSMFPAARTTQLLSL